VLTGSKRKSNCVSLERYEGRCGRRRIKEMIMSDSAIHPEVLRFVHVHYERLVSEFHLIEHY
jgi:hypothetical protein